MMMRKINAPHRRWTRIQRLRMTIAGLGLAGLATAAGIGLFHSPPASRLPPTYSARASTARPFPKTFPSVRVSPLASASHSSLSSTPTLPTHGKTLFEKKVKRWHPTQRLQSFFWEHYYARYYPSWMNPSIKGKLSFTLQWNQKSGGTEWKKIVERGDLIEMRSGDPRHAGKESRVFIIYRGGSGITTHVQRPRHHPKKAFNTHHGEKPDYCVYRVFRPDWKTNR
ncbi:MAG: hypothetical protein V1776_01485 [Candidatus Diapherotrites archaeon]